MVFCILIVLVSVGVCIILSIGLKNFLVWKWDLGCMFIWMLGCYSCLLLLLFGERIGWMSYCLLFLRLFRV